VSPPPPPLLPVQDPELLRFVDLECFLWSTVSADLTPLINAGMVFCDRHYGGINYPVRGEGRRSVCGLGPRAGGEGTLVPGVQRGRGRKGGPCIARRGLCWAARFTAQPDMPSGLAASL
jgi:hypothetical protein